MGLESKGRTGQGLAAAQNAHTVNCNEEEEEQKEREVQAEVESKAYRNAEDATKEAEQANESDYY
jgi:hypothetical protein